MRWEEQPDLWEPHPREELAAMRLAVFTVAVVVAVCVAILAVVLW